MTPDRALNILSFYRDVLLRELGELDDQEVMVVPEGYSNNVLWNAGHILYYSCFSTYRPSGQAIPLPEAYKELFKAGSSPADWTAPPSPTEIVGGLKDIQTRMENDYHAGVFDSFTPFNNGPTLELRTLSEALMFHIAHEGEHIGRITCMKRQLRRG